MTAIIGFCLQNGAFLAADSVRTDVDSGRQWDTPVQKIEQLTDSIVIATGGLGTIGHKARDQLKEIVQSNELNLESIIDKVKEIFSQEFEASFLQSPGHKIPLTCILAGVDDERQGFICSISSSNDFEPFWIRSVGQPYFTGSDTNLVRLVASECIYKLKESDEKLMFDKWVTESVKKIGSQDSAVGFPIQLVAVRENILNVFPVYENYRYLPSFETEFPEL